MDSIRRRWLDVGIANFVAFFVASGFVAATLWLHTTVLAIRDAVCRPVSPQRTYVLESVCLIAVLGMSFSRLYTLETERIWIFLMPIPIAAAASGLARGAQTVRAVRVVTALVLTFAQTWVVEVFVYTWW